jgi:arginase family enzyme
MAIVDANWPRADAWLASEATDPDVVVVGVPTSAASLSPSRADLTPGAVRERLGRFSTFDGDRRIDFGAVRPRDMGNWAVSDLDMHHMPPAVERLAAGLPGAPLTLFLGGDNAITRPLARSSGDLASLGVITLDTHHDVRSLDNGPSNGTPIRGLIEEDGLPGGNVHQIGIHSFANSAAYRSYCDDAGISVTTVADIEKEGIAPAAQRALDDLADRCDRLYVDVDVDVLDRAYAPACPGSRPGGLTVRQLAEAVWLCAAHPSVGVMDFVEVDAAADHEAATLDVVAHLLLTAVSGFASR